MVPAERCILRRPLGHQRKDWEIINDLISIFKTKGIKVKVRCYQGILEHSCLWVQGYKVCILRLGINDVNNTIQKGYYV